MNSVIETHQLSKTFGNVQAVQNLDLHVPEHSIFGFLGPNGAGKTTTIKVLLGLARPTGGSGSILGMDIVKESTAIRRRIGYLPQQPRFYDHLTPRQTLRMMARFFYPRLTKEVENRITESLELVGLEAEADRPLRGFSGGQRQRLGLAQAQIHNPDLLILDEPAAALDPMGRRDVLDIMRRLREKTTIFYSTHILDDVQRVSDMAAILNKGSLVAQARIDTLLAGQQGVTYALSLKGSTETLSDAYRRLEHQPWVSSLNSMRENGHQQWHVTVNDEKHADRQLLPMVVAEPDITVLAFGRFRYELEDIFVNLIEGKSDERIR